MKYYHRFLKYTLLKIKHNLKPISRRIQTNLNAKNENTFSEIPISKGIPILGTIPALILSGGAPKLHLYADKRHKQLGSIFKEKLGNVEAIFISDPEYMRSIFSQEGKHPVHVLPEAWVLYNQLYGCSRGLFFMNSDEWLHNRRIMNRLLLKGNLSFIDEACAIASQNLMEKIALNDDNLENKLYRWSLDTIMAILISAKEFQENKAEFETQLQHLANTLHLVFETSAKLQLVPATIASKYRITSWKRFVKAVDDALDSSNDLVFNLLKKYSKNEGLLSLMIQENMPKSDIIRIIIDLVLAAGDTTAYAMQWVLYSLGKHADIQNRLHTDISTDISTSQLKNFVKETLRLYPVAPFLTRILPETAIIDNYCIPPQSLVLFSLYTSGRNDKYFEDPCAFNPNRWLNRTPLMGQAALPFAMGTRSCVGKKIAETQLAFALKDIIRHFSVELLNKEDVGVILKMVAVPSEPIQLNFLKR